MIGPLAGDDIGGQRHPQGIENRLHQFHLRQVGTVILAVAELEQPVLGHGRVHTGAGAIHVDPFGMQCIDPHHVLIQPRFERHPPRIVTQQVQDNLEPVISEIQRLYRLSRAAPQGPSPVVHPGLDVIQPMVALGQDRAEPDHRDPAEAEPLPVAVSGKVRVQQRWQVHALHLCQQQRNIVDALRDDGMYVVHAQSRRNLGYLQI